jgi:polar amino acid transport system substrate-binding protein
MVGEGKADAAATAIATARLYIAANPGVTIADGFRFVENPDTAGTRIAMPKGADTLTERVNAIIDEVVESGIYMGWYEEYTDYAASLGVD